MTNALKHVGVLGMKWGVRKRGPASSDHVTTRAIRTKHVSELSNDEIKTAVSRMHLERQYKDLSFDTMSRGQKAVASLVQKFGGMAANAYIKQKGGPNLQKMRDAFKGGG